jgi:hypothetical protein
MGAIDDLVSNLQNGVTNLGQLVQVISQVFPRAVGTFTLTAGSATTTVSQASMVANGFPVWIPTNAVAGTLEGSAKKLFLASVTAGSGFSLVTSNGGTAAGTETFAYFAINPS